MLELGILQDVDIFLIAYFFAMITLDLPLSWTIRKSSHGPRTRTNANSWCRPLPMNDITILLIANDKRLIASVEGSLSTLGAARLVGAASCADAVSVLHEHDAALVIAHVTTGADADAAAALLRHLAGSRRTVPTLILCETELVDEGLKLLRLGAADCLMRPLDLSRLGYLADVLTLRRRMTDRPKADPRPGETAGFIYQPDGPLGRVMEQVRRVAPLETSVLIQGETGTGKTRLAHLIHELSPRRKHPFLIIDCGALSANLIESELFGHVRGAFTGADRDRTGKFAAAGEGTVLLDDIDALPLELQPRLLRALEQRVFEPVGANARQVLRARVIAASNRALDDEAQAGRFRKDLYYRLGVMIFYMPPFRENRALAPALARHFVAEYAARDNRPVQGVTPQALRALEAHSWPGNVRELRNVIERAVALCTGTWISLEDLPEPLQRLTTSPPPAAVAPAIPEQLPAVTLAERKQEAEEHVIREVLSRNNNNKFRTAAELGISRMTLYKKLHQYGLMASAAEFQSL
jgi:DNA-binding NtrC family response regulator